MKVSSLGLLFGLLFWEIPAACLATAVGTGTIEQPVNLGPNSDPARIPLGAVGTISNYNYGIHRVIGEPRPCPDGSMQWAGGTELDQNLASVFGISVEAEDSTEVPGRPVTLRVKPWRIPGYSPYTKEQVLAATLWCLLRSAGGTPESPLDVRIVAEGQEDKSLEKFAGKYVTSPGKDGKEVPPPKVPGSVIEEDGRGIAWVVFPEAKQVSPTTAPPPAMILFEATGDGDYGDGMWYLLPIWGNGIAKHAPLHLNSWSAPMCYSRWKSNGRGEANAFLVSQGVAYFDVDQGENRDSVMLGLPSVPQATLAAEILALVVAAQPIEKRPLTIAIRLQERDLASYPAFRGAPGWKETRHDAHNIVLECEFAWDATARNLTKGTVPLVQLNTEGRFTINALAHESPSEAVAKEIAKDTLRRINEGIRDGSLLAEKNMADDMLSRFGLPREIGKAGYYEALARFCNETKVPEKPQEDPFRFGNSDLDQFHRMGWEIGMNWGQSIAKEARNFIEEANRKNSDEPAK
jgi:hypothetical protein